MKSSAVMAAVAIFSCLLVLCAQGHPVGRSSTCHCSNSYSTPPRGFLLKEYKLNVYEPDAFCPQLEIILILPGQKKCLNPNSHWAKLAVQQSRRQQREAAARL